MVYNIPNIVRTLRSRHRNGKILRLHKCWLKHPLGLFDAANGLWKQNRFEIVVKVEVSLRCSLQLAVNTFARGPDFGLLNGPYSSYCRALVEGFDMSPSLKISSARMLPLGSWACQRAFNTTASASDKLGKAKSSIVKFWGMSVADFEADLYLAWEPHPSGCNDIPLQRDHCLSPTEEDLHFPSVTDSHRLPPTSIRRLKKCNKI